MAAKSHWQAPSAALCGNVLTRKRPGSFLAGLAHAYPRFFGDTRLFTFRTYTSPLHYLLPSIANTLSVFSRCVKHTRNLLASTPVLRMSFSTPTEAHRRMGFLICRTFRPRSRDPVRLVDVNNAAKHVFAMYIQVYNWMFLCLLFCLAV